MLKRRAALPWLVMIAACALVAAGCGGETPPAPELPLPDTTADTETEDAAAIVVGPPDAPVKVEAFYPLNEGHQFIADYLKEFAEAHPGQIRLEVYDIQTPAGVKRWQPTGLKCAGVFVNGQTRHEITTDGETETVDFLQRLDVFWTREDFETVVNKLLEQAETGGGAGGAESDEASKE